MPTLPILILVAIGIVHLITWFSLRSYVQKSKSRRRKASRYTKKNNLARDLIGAFLPLYGVTIFLSFLPEGESELMWFKLFTLIFAVFISLFVTGMIVKHLKDKSNRR